MYKVNYNLTNSCFFAGVPKSTPALLRKSNAAAVEALMKGSTPWAKDESFSLSSLDSSLREFSMHGETLRASLQTSLGGSVPLHSSKLRQAYLLLSSHENEH